MPRDVAMPALDGRSVRGTLHEPAGVPRAVVLLNPATAVPRRFYDPFAAFLAQRGHAAITFDWRADRDARMSDWGAKDLPGVIRWARAAFPGAPLAGFGHSAGGQALALTPESAAFDAFVGVAAQSGSWRLWPAPSRWRRALDWHVLIPAVTAVAGRVPAGVGLGAGIPKGVAREWARWARHPDYLLREDADARRANFAAVRCPVLAMGFDDDAYGPRAAVDWWAAQLVNAEVERRQVPAQVGAGHFGFFKARDPNTLWADAVDWLEEALARPAAKVEPR